jgi:hypothetical protein
MIKSILLSATLMLGLTTTAIADTPESCYWQAELGFTIAQSRDSGIHPSFVYELLVHEGMDPDVAVQVVQVIYIEASGFNPEEVKQVIFNNCIGSLS